MCGLPTQGMRNGVIITAFFPDIQIKQIEQDINTSVGPHSVQSMCSRELCIKIILGNKIWIKNKKNSLAIYNWCSRRAVSAKLHSF